MDQGEATTTTARRVAELLRDLRDLCNRDRRLVVTTVAGLGIVALCGALIAQLMDEVSETDDLTQFDQRVLDTVVDHRTPWLTSVARTVTHLGDPWVVVAVVTVAALALVVGRRYHLAVFVVLASGGAALISSVTKQVFDRPRPPTSLWLGTAWGPSFPSGHATQSIACWGALAVVVCVLVHPRVGRGLVIAGAALIALAVGTSRIYLAVHWTSDVVCGWAIASLWLTSLLLAGWATPRAYGLWTTGRAPDPPEAGGATQPPEAGGSAHPPEAGLRG
jgi:membrane-associated phospholipid phosphatase